MVSNTGGYHSIAPPSFRKNKPRVSDAERHPSSVHNACFAEAEEEAESAVLLSVQGDHCAKWPSEPSLCRWSRETLTLQEAGRKAHGATGVRGGQAGEGWERRPCPALKATFASPTTPWTAGGAVSEEFLEVT